MQARSDLSAYLPRCGGPEELTCPYMHYMSTLLPVMLFNILLAFKTADYI